MSGALFMEITRKPRFTDIERIVERTLQRVAVTTLNSLDDVLDRDEQARAVSRESVALL